MLFSFFNNCDKILGSLLTVVGVSVKRKAVRRWNEALVCELASNVGLLIL